MQQLLFIFSLYFVVYFIMIELFQNMNAKMVDLAVHEKRERERSAHEVKVERDKKSREAQKQKQMDRKEREKKRTQKHERRRL